VALWVLIDDISEDTLQSRFPTSRQKIAYARWLMKNAGLDYTGKNLFQTLEKPLSEVKINQQKGFHRYSDVYWIVGVVENVGKEPLYSVEMITTYYDASGSVVKMETDLIAENGLATLLPGEISPFKIVIGSLSPWIGQDEGIGIDRYEMEVIYARTISEPYREFDLEGVKTSVDSEGWFRITGKVINVGELDARNVQVVATFYNAAGHVIDCRAAPTDPEELESGKSGSFIASTLMSEEVDHWTLQVDIWRGVN
jgi:hypothetical protein